MQKQSFFKKFIQGVKPGNGLLRKRLNAAAHADAETQLKIAETNRIIDALARDYGGVNYIELSENKLDDVGISYRTSELLKQLGPEADDSMKFTDKMNLLLTRAVYEPDRDRFYSETRRERVLEELSKSDTYSIYPRFLIQGEIRYYEMKFSAIRENGRITAIVAGLRSIDEERKREMKHEEAARLVESVASSYNVALKVNMADDSVDFLRLEPLFVNSSRISGIKTFTDIRRSLAEVIHPGDRERVLRELDCGTIRSRLEDKNSYNVEYRVLDRGGVSWHEFNVTKIDGDEVAVGFKENDYEIIRRRTEEKRYGQYFALFAVDIDTETLKVVKNEERYQVCGVGESVPYTPFIQGLAQAVDEEAKEFFLRISDISTVKRDFAADDKRTYAYKSIILDNDKWVSVTAYCILRRDDGAPSVITLGFSLVDAFAAEREELRRQLQEALHTAQSANEAKTEFLFNMSHDFRTPMNAIIGFNDMALKNIDDREKAADCLKKARQSENVLLSLINGVLEMGKLETEELELEEERSDVRKSFEDIDVMMYDLAATKNISITFEAGGITDPYVYADCGKCNRIFLNILTNAVNFTNPGGHVRARVEQAGKAENGTARYRYTFTDDGIGMSREFAERAFDRFTRERNTTESGVYGTGTGLALCRIFTEMMGGTIQVESAPGKGSTFTVELPFRILDGQDIEAYRKEKGLTEEIRRKACFTGKRVLLVEDNELNREIAKDILEDEGIIVETAEDGDIAVQKVSQNGTKAYDYIIMDIQMPRMNGYEATGAIRKLPGGDAVPIIAVSANAFEEDRRKSLEAGMDGHLAKPVNVEKLKETLAGFLRE